MKPLTCVLLVDDNYATNLLHKKIMENLEVSAQIRIAENGEQAINYLDNSLTINGDQYPNPELIFLDINMPKMNGWEFLEEYRKREFNSRRRIIVIMLTTSPNPDDEKKAQVFPEIAGYIKKPLLPKEVEALLEKHFGEV